MTRAKRPILSLVIAAVLVMGVAGVIWKVPPSPVVELAVIGIATGAVFLILAWLLGRKKTATILTIFILVVILLRRLGILNWISLGLWTLVIGLISLVY